MNPKLSVFIFMLLFVAGVASAAPICNVKNYGALGDNKTLDTQAIQAAVQACQGTGGIVELPVGQYLSGTITLGSNMTFQLDEGASLSATPDISQYPDLTPSSNNTQLKAVRKALLYADRASHLTIQGPGRIYGSGDWSTWSGDSLPTTARPSAIFAFQTSNLLLSHLQVNNAAMWAVVLMETVNSAVDLLNVNSPDGVTHDGIDVVDGHDISITNTTVNSGDDSICLKSGIVSGLQRVTVKDSHILGSVVANGLKFGTASAGLLQSVSFENIDINNVRQAAIALESVDGAHIQDVSFKNIRIKNSGTFLYMILGWRGNQSRPNVGSINGVDFQNITGDSFTLDWGSAISGTSLAGISYAPTHILFENVNLVLPAESGKLLPVAPAEYQGQYPDPRLWGALPAAGMYFRHVQQISFDHVQITSSDPQDVRPILVPAVDLKAPITFDVP